MFVLQVTKWLSIMKAIDQVSVCVWGGETAVTYIIPLAPPPHRSLPFQPVPRALQILRTRPINLDFHCISEHRAERGGGNELCNGVGPRKHTPDRFNIP